MEIAFQSNTSKVPTVSVILLDWSVRTSYHVLDYLNHQSEERENYEIIWVEYYNNRSREIELGLKKCLIFGMPPIVDKWIIMEMPQDIYYHKHLMYNVGILASLGDIIVFCDSDAMLKPSFVHSVISSFTKDRNIILHMDEVRSLNRKFYPFNYPSFDEFVEKDCVNLVKDKPRGLTDTSDPLHVKNYGACMAALREDIIAIGGADEHIDYLGHICGPHEMTFRLINTGKKEMWHKSEWLYHTYHPGQAGKGNYLGPHDGKHMSTTTLEVCRTGRILPLVENPAIKKLRLGTTEEPKSLTLQVIPGPNSLKEWKVPSKLIQNIKYVTGFLGKIGRFGPNGERTFSSSLTAVFIICICLAFGIRHIYTHATNKNTYDSLPIHGGWRKIPLLTYQFFKQKLQYYMYVAERCHKCLYELSLQGVNDVTIFGVNEIAGILCFLTRIIPIKISAVYDSSNGAKMQKKSFHGIDILLPDAVNSHTGKIIVADDIDTVGEGMKVLNRIGVDKKRIVLI